MLNFAHRGFSGKYPENTMLAFRKAVEAGADGIELDVHLSKDGEIVIMHDERVNRTTDGEGFIADYTYDELLNFDASADFMGEYGVNRIPTLREYFEFIKPIDGFLTNIELKTDRNEYPGIEAKTAALIAEFDLADRIIISGFNHYSVLRFKKIMPEVKCGFLYDCRMAMAGEYAESRGVECMHPKHTGLTEENVPEIKSHGIEINAWTVNTSEDVSRLYSLGITSVIGNYPDMAKETIESLMK